MKPAIKNVRLQTLQVFLPHAVYLGRLVSFYQLAIVVG
jgi:hypothetical protein